MTSSVQIDRTAARRHAAVQAVRVASVAAVAAGMLVVPTVAASAAEPVPVAPRLQTLEVSGVDSQALAAQRATTSTGPAGAPADRPELLTAQVSTGPFTLAGVTWPAQTRVSGVQVRVRERGRWSDWERLPAVDEGPDAGTAEHERASARVGTSPLVSDGADGVQVRVDTADGRAPADVQVSLIDPGTSPADSAATELAKPAASADAAGAGPRIVTRAQWGADESLTRGPHRVNETVRTLVLHHTAGSNSYSQAQAVSQLRGVYAYHTSTLGWSDIGYNLVVDRYGTVYEGRRGSIDLAVQGAHAGGFNRDTYGVSVMGNFVGQDPPAAVVTALSSVVGWKLGQYGADPRGTTELTSAGGGTARWPAGTRVRVANVMGHEDVGETSCPGELYDLLPHLRTAAATLAARTPAVLRGPSPKDLTGDRVADLLVIDRAGGLLLYPGSGQGRLATPRRVGHGWHALDQVIQVGDLDADGRADVVAREPRSGTLRLYRGDGAGGFLGWRQIGHGWNGMDTLLGVGDLNRDTHRDLVARRRDGTLWSYLGDGTGRIAGRQIGSGFQTFDLLVAAADFSDDGDPDLIGRKPDGRLFLYEGSPSGALGRAEHTGFGWQSMTAVLGTGSWDARPGADLVSRRADGRLLLYSGDATGGFAGAGVQIGNGWGALRFVP